MFLFILTGNKIHQLLMRLSDLFTIFAPTNTSLKKRYSKLQNFPVLQSFQNDFIIGKIVLRGYSASLFSYSDFSMRLFALSTTEVSKEAR